MYRAVLIPTDGSIGARRAADHGIKLAAEHDATVHTIYVVDERRHETAAYGSDEAYIERLETEGERAMQEITEAAKREGLDVVTACSRGRPDEAILQYADENDVDLIVVGIHGRTPTHGTHPKGVAQRVRRDAPTSVVFA